ncbi:MAG: hypothetical protein IKU03_05215 [Bacteroidales bacterium]|nr:hypothetical protein [Bacteroidales bacterium]
MKEEMTVTPQFPDFGALLESVKENGRLMREDHERYRQAMAEREAKWEKEKAERDAKWEKEKAEREAKWEKDRADTRRAIREMRELFTTQWGRLVEALCKPAALALFKKEGVQIDRIYEGIHKAKVDGQDVMEIDVALCDTTTAVIVEVKSRCDNHDIDYFLSQMGHCKEWYPDFANKQLYVAVAAIEYAGGADTYASRQGLYVLQLGGEDTYTMTAPREARTY